MVSMLTSSVVDRGFKPRSGQTKDYKISICCFTAKQAVLRSKSKDWLARNNVSEWSDMSTVVSVSQLYCHIVSSVVRKAFSLLRFMLWLIDCWCLMPLSAIFQLYHGNQYPERTTDHGQATGKLYHLRLRVECTLFCNLQSRTRTHAVLVIGLYELLGNPTT